jgi:hypothetical protein
MPAFNLQEWLLRSAGLDKFTGAGSQTIKRITDLYKTCVAGSPHVLRATPASRPKPMHACTEMGQVVHAMYVVSVENPSTPVVRYLCYKNRIPFLPLESGDFTSNLTGPGAWKNCYLGMIRGALVTAKCSCPRLQRVTLIGIVPTWAHAKVRKIKGDAESETAKKKAAGEPCGPSFAWEEQKDLRDALQETSREQGIFSQMDKMFDGSLEGETVADYHTQLLYMTLEQFHEMHEIIDENRRPSVFHGFDINTGMAGGVSG